MAELTINRLGHLGDGIADEGTLVPLSLPGEVVRGEVTGGRMEAPAIVTPSAERVAAPCRHFPACGGCGLQHGADGFVAGWKEGVVRAALTARKVAAEFRPIVTSPARSRRRAVLSGRRTKKGALVGFHARRSDTVIEVPECLLVTPAILAARETLIEMTRAGGSRKGEIAYTVTETRGGLDVAATGGKPMDPALNADLVRLAHAGRLARLSWNGEPVVTLTAPQVAFDGVAVTLPPGAFLQATVAGETALRNGVTQAVGAARQIADLFAGCGTFALPLSRRAQVHAVEGDGAMIAALDAGWRAGQDLHAVSGEVRDLFRRPLMAGDLKRFDAVVIDPPRAGAQAQVTELAASTVPVVAAVSCNPVSFARDAEILIAGGFRLDWVQVVDQFRWSPHVELVARFVRD
ncbi:class I SAM-dependent RNA methyltransferase [Meridianimarinicoccus sp. MJW13]|uniref:class I SAM-dependent RNA methyltransferase n=1 Tax=Meridianimarinicoccus sp. MJW13 TaxID=2720031 RepID=UPI001865DEFC|nr:class I SAM-dependent RNA methyltransferase [Fluviibacterium sp. MJW13]